MEFSHWAGEDDFLMQNDLFHEDIDSLFAEWDSLLNACFHPLCGNGPYLVGKINFLPGGGTGFTRSR